MATTFPRYNHIISKTLDPIFAILIGVSAAGIRIRREENEKRFGLATTSMVKPGATNPRVRPIAGAGEAGFEEEGGEVEEIGFAEVARVGWERVWRRVSGEGVDG
ncbi:hypothetical protein N7G274_005415 [Stereocaulon virgatum]|uniref:Uncharacterized protein n=1 Tax=Stereocaulon virgatum TaxID=373712 RepID=A0ABR4A9R6_9LECA